jgi:peptidoglycan/xylan/chitin deacetylase (PgdA/CDA1 family)
MCRVSGVVRRGALGFAVAVVSLAVSPSLGAAQLPAAVQDASLTQKGQDLVWYVRSPAPFSPLSLARAHAALCLLLTHHSLSRKVCVAPGRHDRPPSRLLWGHRDIGATVRRSSVDSLRASFLPSAVGLGYRRLHWQTVILGAACNGVCASFPAQPKLLKLHVPKLIGCVASGPPFVSHGSASGRMIALTFDDGPWYDTPQFLDVLERDHVAATFFQIGEQIAQYGSVDRRILRDGDMIGDHTWNHADVAGDGSFAAGEIGQTAAAIATATGGFRPCLFRAPGGAVSSALIATARRLGFTTIQWDVDPRDWSLPGTGAIYSNVVANARPGAIVLQHDGGGNRSETLAALPGEITTLRGEGYRFVTVTQMLGYRLIYK